MRVSREQAAQNRERVVEVAARMFREHGFEGIGVADLMKEAGLTHGGFYGQFGSKEALMAEACARAFEISAARWQAVAERSSDTPAAALVDWYLTRTHRDHPGEGCVVAALGAEAARHGPEVRRSLTQGVRRLVDLLAGWLPGRSRAAREEKALATFAAMVGALVIARAVEDPQLSQGILNAVAASVRKP